MDTRITFPSLAVLSLMATGTLLTPTSRADIDISTVAYTGMPAPGMSGRQLARFISTGDRDSLQLNERGEAAFCGAAQLPGKKKKKEVIGLWAGTPGQLRLVAASDQHAPGMSKRSTLKRLDLRYLCDTGQVCFLAADGLWMCSPGREPRLIAHKNVHKKKTVLIRDLPRLAKREFARATRAGRVLFWSEQALLAWVDGGYETIIKPGDPTPDTPDLTFKSLGLFHAAGPYALVEGMRTGPGVSGSNARGWWLFGPRDGRKVAAEGDPAPGLDGLTIGAGVGSIRELNAQGALSCGLGARGSGSHGWDDGRFFSLALPRLNDAVPGRAGDSVAWHSQLLEGASCLAVCAPHVAAQTPAGGEPTETAGGHPTPVRTLAVFAGPFDDLKLIDRLDRASDTDYPFYRLEHAVGSPAGVIAIEGSAQWPETQSPTEVVSGIWAGRPGAIRLVVREGQSLELASGDTRVVEPHGLRLHGINSRGQVLFSAKHPPILGRRDASIGLYLATVFPGNDRPE